MIKCPKCEAQIYSTDMEIEIQINSYGEHLDVNILCPNGHEWFARITEKDLIEV